MSNVVVNKVSKLALASAAAALFSTVIAPVTFADHVEESSAAKTSSIKCQGINACKGQSKCHTASNDCAGQNSCKGKGWVFTPNVEECSAQGGTVIK